MLAGTWAKSNPNFSVPPLGKVMGRPVIFLVVRLDVYSMNIPIFFSAILATLLFCAGCGSQPAQLTIDRVRSEAATILKKDSSQIDVAKPLLAQGADELDLVEIIMQVEEAFKVEIPDSALEETVRSPGGFDYGESDKTLSVQKIAEIVTRLQKT